MTCYSSVLIISLIILLMQSHFFIHVVTTALSACICYFVTTIFIPPPLYLILTGSAFWVNWNCKLMFWNVNRACLNHACYQTTFFLISKAYFTTRRFMRQHEAMWERVGELVMMLIPCSCFASVLPADATTPASENESTDFSMSHIFIPYF